MHHHSPTGIQSPSPLSLKSLKSPKRLPKKINAPLPIHPRKNIPRIQCAHRMLHSAVPPQSHRLVLAPTNGAPARPALPPLRERATDLTVPPSSHRMRKGLAVDHSRTQYCGSACLQLAVCVTAKRGNNSADPFPTLREPWFRVGLDLLIVDWGGRCVGRWLARASNDAGGKEGRTGKRFGF